jgi:lipid-A-disaccharide synthase
MWFKGALANLREFFRQAHNAERYFQTEKPDAVILIDFPGFHWALAKRAHAAGVPVYFFVPPQLWGWAGWRVRKVRRWFSAVLTALPFEETWYRDRGVRTHHVGHPYFDELADQQLDAGFLADQRAKGGRVVAVLPGSRNQEVAANFPIMLDAMREVHAKAPGVRFLVASFNAAQRDRAEAMAAGSGLPVEFHVGRTPEIIELAEVCLSVSGSVSLEMMFRQKPAVIVYKTSWLVGILAIVVFMTVKYITLVNLLAGKEVYPEFPTVLHPSGKLAGKLLAWLNDPAAHAACVAELRKLRDEVARPGACERAAEFLIAEIEQRALPTADSRAA